MLQLSARGGRMGGDGVFMILIILLSVGAASSYLVSSSASVFGLDDARTCTSDIFCPLSKSLRLV